MKPPAHRKNLPREEEDELVRRIAAGDPAAETQLVNQYREAVGLSVNQKLKGRSQEQIEDVIADVLLIMLENLRAGKFEPGDTARLGAYISAIARNQASNFFRKEKKPVDLQNVDKRPETAQENSADFDLQNRQLHSQIQNIIAGLDEKYVTVLQLQFYEGKKVVEISKLLNLPPQKVSDLLKYARDLIRKKVAENNIFPDLQD